MTFRIFGGPFRSITEQLTHISATPLWRKERGSAVINVAIPVHTGFVGMPMTQAHFEGRVVAENLQNVVVQNLQNTPLGAALRLNL